MKKVNQISAKAKLYSTYIAPQAVYCSCSGAFVSQTQQAYSLQIAVRARAHRLWPATKQPYAVLGCRLMVTTPIIHVITWITSHLPTPKGWKAELAWLADPQWTICPQSGHLSNIDQEKSASRQRPNHWPMHWAQLLSSAIRWAFQGLIKKMSHW